MTWNSALVSRWLPQSSDLFFPPSIPMVLLGVMAELSITGLFLGGVLPAFVIAIFMMIYIYFYAKGETICFEPATDSGRIP